MATVTTTLSSREQDIFSAKQKDMGVFNRQTLSKWSFREAGTSFWIKSKHERPRSEIHVDLRDNGLIPDPFVGTNEISVQWVADKEWEYSTRFDVSHLYTAAYHDLVVEGLDTYANVYVNDKLVLETSNMFVGHRIALPREILKSTANILRVYFKNNLQKAKDLEFINGQCITSNGDSSRSHIRKAQYHYGWDWGPLLLTCGPYKPIHVDSYDILLDEILIKDSLSKDLKQVNLDLNVICSSSTDQTKLVIEVHDPQGHKVAQTETKILPGQHSLSQSIKLVNPSLWYPVNTGEQNLYSFVFMVVSADGVVLLRTVKQKGFRKVQLIQHEFEEQPGTSFYFEVNGVPVYSAGSCWIPAHSFTSELSNDDYRKWLKLAVDGNQNMIRVWGGGLYEPEVFYEECDRLGLMVWQDFMFACGIYPAYDDFVESVKQEATYQLKRLHNYCSIVAYAGNNEDYQVAEVANLDMDSKDARNSDFPARYIYETVLPKLVENLVSNAEYRAGSPYGGKTSDDPTVGDIHQWNVWHGTQEPYQDWWKLGGRFVSEFGMLALPNRKTIDSYLEDGSSSYVQSKVMDHHNKADGFERRLGLYVLENIPVGSLDIDSWRYATQLMQSECLSYAYRYWRREWRGAGKEYNGGALVWQLNDCWPVTSWAICDFYRRPKLAYYAVKRESAPIALGMQRRDVTASPVDKSVEKYGFTPGFDYTKKIYEVDIWAANGTLTSIEGTLKVQSYHIETGVLLKEKVWAPSVLKPNQSNELGSGKNSEKQSILNHFAGDKMVLYATLTDSNGNIIARTADWPQPLKYLTFPETEVECRVFDSHIVVSTNNPVKGVEIILESDITLEDNGFDLFPGDERVIGAAGITKKDVVDLRYLGSGVRRKDQQ